MAIDVENYYRKYGPMVLRRCRYMLKDEETALDVMQDVFVELLRREDSLKHYAPSSLLYTIASNLCLNKIRGEKRKPMHSGSEILERIAGSDDPEETALSRHFLERLFQNEKTSTKRIAVLHYVDRLTLEETAAEVGLSVSGVRKRLRNLRKRGLELKEV